MHRVYLAVLNDLRLLGSLALTCACLSIVGAEKHTDFSTPHGANVEGDMEHLVVTGETESSGEAERRAYLDFRRGMFLYGQGSYDEALPYLISSAKYGYKDSQARLAHLYLHGLGGVNRSDVVGIAWMGVAAHGETTPIIQRHYDQLMAAVPSQHMASLKQVVEEYVEKYGQFDQNVVCDIAKHASTLISKNRCYFEYEFTVMSATEIADMRAIYLDQIIPPDQFSSFSIMDNLSSLPPSNAPPAPRPPTE